ncbi:thrombospondin type-1 domain-containing protein 7A-like isoform X2 [Mercenaria mercenaria]|uniref:thrombospondin type-1 domain-containing protein 7A-like isoform X2 n=1 Tax=Mercenaria mercenaria TaxID=6596 RepID=UPI00234FB21C|nr:thrombospondin type-1 domain-containing protein 7A-like isoform X2 [Mercenaria mercenaria]
MGHGSSTESHAHLHSHVLYVLFFLLSVIISGTSAIRYVWKTGLWMECQHYSCGKGGSQFRSVYCGEAGEYKYNEYDASMCSHLPKPKNVQECFKVCEQHQNALRWAVTVWSDCTLRPEFRTCSIKHGIRYRNVTCVWRENGRVEDDNVCSEFEPKPDTEESCDLKCPQNCVVSLFSSWNINNCDKCRIVNKTRTRELIIPPANGGISCPTFTEMFPCDNCADIYTYKIGVWDECMPYNMTSKIRGQVHPQIGYQKRNIHCINTYGSIVLYKHCVEYLRSTVSQLVSSQTCIIPQDCIVSEWSQWSPHNSSCVREDGSRSQGYMVRSRSVLQIPLGAGKPCPNLIHYFPLKPVDETACIRTYWKMSSWSECKIPAGSYGCTTGLQTRNAFCVQNSENGKEKPIPDGYCKERRPLTSQTCRAECDLDCTVSHWTQWTECKVTDCELYLRRRRANEGTGQRYRTRKVLTEVRGRGNMCPHLSETQTCDPQPCFHWNMTVGLCQLLNPNTSPPCGLGTAYRTISCVNKLGLRVADSKCEELSEMPSIKEDCNIPCPRDCILSKWSPWSQCPNLCQEGGSTDAPIQTRERTILAQSGPGGAPCPPNRQLTEIKTCPTVIECAVYVWQTDPWSPCAPRESGVQCGPGIQQREVGCYSLQGQMVNDIRCTLKVKPPAKQSCEVACPVNCEVTEYSDWSQCSASCFEATQILPRQTRVRHIIQEPMYGGAPCPNILSEVKHCNNLTFCEGYYWDLGTWSRCILPPHKIPQCGQGIQARDVSCRLENGTLQPIDVCIRHIGPLPQTSKPCYKSCDEECVFEEWSEWSQCINGCNGKRFRTRKLIEDARTVTKLQCRDTRFYPLDSFEECLCDTHLPVAIGNWSKCILEADETYYRTRTFQDLQTESAPGVTLIPRTSASVGVNAICGPGQRYKVLACQNEIGEVEAANKCSLKPYEEETCLIPCPVDCVMSDWSLWTDCSTSCGTGTQMRYRHIKQNPSDGGRLCPSLDNAGKETQTRVCQTDCRRNKWRTYKWSPCMPVHHGAICGNGSQSRSVRCEVFTAHGFINEALDERLCLYHFKPIDRRSCYSPCVGECVVSEWTAWSRCQQPCADPNQVQIRTRTVLRQPSDDPIHVCPILLDERFCIRGDNCVEYTWILTDWTSCLVNNGQDECGVGHKERYPVCQDQTGRIVDDELCVLALGESTELLVVACQIPCDVDCLLTEWSPWSECSSTCDLGEQLRMRDIVEEPRGNGRQCPGIFEQRKPCFVQGCYTWIVSDWSECTNQKGVCGHGVQTRNVTCVANGGLPVNGTNCEPDLDIIILPTEQPCTIPCPGECVITDWTEWNECFIDCKNYDRPRYTRGVQSRSRAVLAHSQMNYPPCPEQLWDSRPCEATKCFTFHWKTSEWSEAKTRSVWCERSDGLRVTGGCEELARPATVLNCNPLCSLLNSICNDTNHCVCLPGHEPVYNRLNVLIECIKMDNSTDASPASDSVTLPTDGPTNIWMYAVIAAGTLFVIFLAVACYTMSEFFHKGPRPRSKRADEKSIEGADRLDGMVAETELGSCNHVPHGAPINKSEVDSISVISADRTPPLSVRAPACNGHASMRVHRQSPTSFNDDSPEFISHYSGMHDPAHLIREGDKSEELHVSSYVVSNEQQPPHYDACDQIYEETNRKGKLDDFVAGTPAGLRGSPERKHLLPLYSEVNKNGKLHSNLETVNPIEKPARCIESTSKHTENSMKLDKNHNESIWGKASSVMNAIKRVLPGSEKTSYTPNCVGSNETSAHVFGTDKVQRLSNKVPIETSSHDIVYMNREASKTDLRDEPEQKKNSLQEILKTYFDTTLNSNEFSSEKDKLLDEKENEDNLKQSHDENHDDFNEMEREPFLSLGKTKHGRTAMFSFKSHSLEQAEKQDYDRSYDSDDSIGKSMSLRSQSSMRSRISRISNLSVASGPIVKIDPDESRRISQGRNYQSLPITPKRKRNIAYVAFSSFETETSEAPSSSVSCESLSPRSLPSETQSDHFSDQYKAKGQQDNQSDKSSRNVAIGSLKHKNRPRNPTKNTDLYFDIDSGVGSLPKSINGSKASSETRNLSKKHGNSVPQINVTRASVKRRNEEILEKEVYDKLVCETNGEETKMNGRGKHKEMNGHEVEEHGDEGDSSEKLLTPLYFLDTNAKRGVLRKQQASEIDEYEC